MLQSFVLNSLVSSPYSRRPRNQNPEVMARTGLLQKERIHKSTLHKPQTRQHVVSRTQRDAARPKACPDPPRPPMSFIMSLKSFQVYKAVVFRVSRLHLSGVLGHTAQDFVAALCDPSGRLVQCYDRRFVMYFLVTLRRPPHTCLHRRGECRFPESKQKRNV